MTSTKYHIHIPIAALMAMSDDELAETLSPGTAVELRAMLVCMRAAGKTVFTGGNCDRQDVGGACMGHASEDAVKSGKIPPGDIE